MIVGVVAPYNTRPCGATPHEKPIPKGIVLPKRYSKTLFDTVTYYGVKTLFFRHT